MIPRILVVHEQESVTDLLCRWLGGEGYECRRASHVESACEMLEGSAFSLVLVALRMPGRSGLDLVREIKSRWPRAVVVMITLVEDIKLAVMALKLGAFSYVVQPLDRDEVIINVINGLRRRVLEKENVEYRRHVSRIAAQRTTRLQQTLERLHHSYDETIHAISAALDRRGGDLDHPQKVIALTRELAIRIGFREKELSPVVRGACLRDIGTIAIPESILNKPAELTADEWRVVKNHVELGYDLIKRIEFLEEPAKIVLHHHERWDGTGYPMKLKRAEIPLSARIVALAGAFDAMTTDKSYRKALSPEAARSQIESCAGGQFDPRLSRVFMEIPMTA